MMFLLANCTRLIITCSLSNNATSRDTNTSVFTLSAIKDSHTWLDRSTHPSMARYFKPLRQFYTLKKLEQMISQLLLKMMMMTAATQARYLPTHPPTREMVSRMDTERDTRSYKQVWVQFTRTTSQAHF